VKTKIPDALNADLPPTIWGKILSATPVVLTVVATMLAGLASSEMTRAQYDRSLAAQQQSKAGDQWSFFQAKKLRGALQANTLDMVASTAEVRSLDEAALRAVLPNLPVDRAMAALVKGGGLPAPGPAPTMDVNVKAAHSAMETSRSDPEIDELLAKVDVEVLEGTVRQMRAHALATDAATTPISDAIEEIEQKLVQSTATSSLRRDFTAARLRYHSRRYDVEARINQTIGTLYELQVRKSNLSAERHHRRSQKFFYGMLAAQLGVIVSTLAMAARRRNLLWSLAAASGVIAVAFALYVYLYV
jgi:hypothetical protein